MSFVRVTIACVVVGLLTMFTTTNVDFLQTEDIKDFFPILHRKKRATGYKPSMVFGKCGGSHYGSFGWLASPNFPGSSYPSLSTCNWTISVYPRMIIKFDFVFMDMEEGPIQKKSSCQSDYLIIRNGPGPDDPMVGGQSYCGRETPFNTVYSSTNQAWIYFASNGKIEGEGFAIRWSASNPPTAQFNCDFEEVNGLCVGWKQSKDDVFDWTVHNGMTQSGKTVETGPTQDHTKRNALGKYAYIEASGEKEGQNAIMISPTVRVRNSDGQCLRFWYHMRGDTMGVLNVYKQEVIPGKNSTTELIFSKTGNYGLKWRGAQINVTASNYRVRILFEGVRGSSFKGDMAIDDIFLNRAPCRYFAPTTKTTTTTRSTTTRKVRPTRPKPTTRSKTRPTTRPETYRRTTRRTTTPFTTTTQAEKCAGQYACKEVGNCIPASYFCDEVPDCLHAEDEEGCEYAVKTSSNENTTTFFWSFWGPWSSCGVTCGGGTVERTRFCNNEEESSFTGCIGSSLEAKECNTNKCLKWNDWEGWGTCTRTCGNGAQVRARTCNGGKSGQSGCLGPLMQVNDCNKHNCPKWSSWAGWSECKGTCENSTITRSRTCEGGQIGDSGCKGDATQSKQCANTAASCKDVAIWAGWGDYGECSVTCGEGIQTRGRECYKNGVKTEGCWGSSSESKDCKLRPCEAWSEWSLFSACSVTCGEGTQGRTRECRKENLITLACSGNSTESRVCYRGPCIAWTEWGAFGECSVTCGLGQRSKTRKCKLGGLVIHGGCRGSSSEIETCDSGLCPEWSEWQTFGKCSVTCGKGQRARTRECKKGGTLAQECVGTASESEDCITVGCSVPKWTSWDRWSDCTVSCGRGHQERKRYCLAGENKATECPGKDRQQRPCSRKKCPVDPCASKPCQNGGSCIPIQVQGDAQDFVCACPVGYKGKECLDDATRICYTGVSTRSAVVPTGSRMLPTSCADPSDSCMIATVLAHLKGVSVYVDTAQCAKTTACKVMTCEMLKNTMPAYDVKSCKIVCCDEDHCNTAPLDLPTFTTTPYSTKPRKITTTRKPKTKPTRKTRKPTRKPPRTTPATKPTFKPQRTTQVATTSPAPTIEKSGPHWSDWQMWQQCTHRCGPDGKRRRFRFCMKGAPGMPGCMPDTGTTEIEACNTDASCSMWREWTNWQTCSRTCGGGTHERRRSCDGGAPNTGGCMGKDVEQRNCNEQSCDAMTTSTTTTSTTTTTTTTAANPTTKLRKKPMWSNWNVWELCSAECGGGTQTRMRLCTNGKAGRRGCKGSVKQTQSCNTAACVTTTIAPPTTTQKKRPKWSEWSYWEACSVTCGKGSTSRSRDCIHGSVGRRGCRGKKVNKRPCDAGECTIEVTCMERNAKLARRNGRRCLAACTTDNDCTGKKCVCDGLCGKTCQDTSKKCINMLAFDVTGTIMTCSNGISVGSKCTFSCEINYKLEGNPVTYCQGNRKWTGQKRLGKCIALAVPLPNTKAPTTPARACIFKRAAQNACCGKIPYNSAKTRCCNGKVRAAGPKMTECCGTRAYDPVNLGCCAEKTYKKSNQKCEDDKIVRI